MKKELSAGTKNDSSTKDDSSQVSQPIAKHNVLCRLSNTRTGETEVYTEAVYTKLDGMYGYLCIDGLKVKFFWDNEGQVCCDHLTHFIVSYEIS